MTQLSLLPDDCLDGGQGVTVPVALGRSLGETEAKRAPARLFLAGDGSLLQSTPRVAVVGARRASARGLEAAEHLSRWLAERGIVVVSGLADGIDTVAHETAIRAGGRTIAVLGTQLSDAYPQGNRELQLRIMREHLAVSQFARGVPTRAVNFPQRNRTLALLADASVIVEADEKSGSLHHGWEALRLGRPLFVMRAQFEDPTLTWPRALVRSGARVLEQDAREALSDALPKAVSVSRSAV